MDEFEAMDKLEAADEFEVELRGAFQRRPAPPSLKRKLMERRSRQRTERLRFHAAMWQRLAATVALAAVLGGGLFWRDREQRRKGEAAREQVLTALRITSQALELLNTELADRNRAQE